MVYRAVFVLFINLFLCSCISANKYTIVSTIPKGVSTPKWVEASNDTWKEKSYIYFKYMIEGTNSYEDTQRILKAKSYTFIAEQLKNILQNELLVVNSTDKPMVLDTINSRVDGLILSNIEEADKFTQYIKIKGNKATNYVYRSYVLMRMPISEYEEIKNRIQE